MAFAEPEWPRNRADRYIVSMSNTRTVPSPDAVATWRSDDIQIMSKMALSCATKRDTGDEARVDACICSRSDRRVSSTVTTPSSSAAARAWPYNASVEKASANGGTATGCPVRFVLQKPYSMWRGLLRPPSNLFTQGTAKREIGKG